MVGSLDLLKPVENAEVVSLGEIDVVEVDAHVLDRLVEGMVVPVVQLASAVDARNHATGGLLQNTVNVVLDLLR